MKDELNCPHCGQRMTYNLRESKLMCAPCGYSPLDAKMAQQANSPRRDIRLTHRGDINPNALAAFRTGHDHLHHDQPDKARESFKRALYFQRDFADAHLWLAELSQDEKTKREHLSAVIAFDSSNPEALRQLMVLNGRLTPEQAAQTHHHNEPQVMRVEIPITTQIKALLCPICSGNLTVDEVSGHVECRFCGHSEQRQPTASSGLNGDSLTMALLERKANPVRWVIGERLLHCNECGAERTLPARKLSHDCPFCGSTHVILQDALGSFEQPDGLVPFKISRQQAGESIKNVLGGMVQRIANLFDNNRVKRATLDGVYLPYWVFDAVADITETRTYKGTSRDSGFVRQRSQTQTRFTDGLYDVLVPAVTSPPQPMLDRIGRFDLNAAQAYDPRLLARYPAELYSIDFDKASLEARSIVSREMRRKHEAKELGDERVEIRVFAAVQQMSFRLILMPVWVATLIEEDGDLRTALVNGQTGRVALGKAQKTGS